MPPKVEMFVRMVTTGHQWQRISSLDDFAEMDKEGAELAFCQLPYPQGVDAAGNGIKISTDGQQEFGLIMDAIEQWEQGHREVDSSPLRYVVREGIILFPELIENAVDYWGVATRHRFSCQPIAMTMLTQHEANRPFVGEFVSVVSDQEKVWDLLCSQLELTDDAVVIKTFKAKCEGRGAFVAV